MPVNNILHWKMIAAEAQRVIASLQTCHWHTPKQCCFAKSWKRCGISAHLLQVCTLLNSNNFWYFLNELQVIIGTFASEACCNEQNSYWNQFYCFQIWSHSKAWFNVRRTVVDIGYSHACSISFTLFLILIDTRVRSGVHFVRPFSSLRPFKYFSIFFGCASTRFFPRLGPTVDFVL